MKYSKKQTIKLATEINRIPCLINLNDLILKEGCSNLMPVFLNDEIVIDMDCVESKLAKEEKRIKKKSMDSAFIIANAEKGEEVLLVEFRFNYKNMKNLDKFELFDKVNGSTSALKATSINICDKYIYVFNSDLKEQAVRRFRNMVPSMPVHYVATDIVDLKARFF